MLLAIDLGNTNVTIGLYEGAHLVRSFCLQTHRNRTADEYGLALVKLLRTAGVQPSHFAAAAIASVVPPLTPVLAAACRVYVGLEPLLITSALRALAENRYDDPGVLGADRLVNAVAGWQNYGVPAGRTVAVVDFGTATKIEVVTAAGEYLGGCIGPGIGISTRALYESAARLPRVEIARPPQVLGRNNPGALQSGMVYGYAGQVDGLLTRMAEELGAPPLAVATGGLAPLVARESRLFQKVDPWLTLDGIRIVWEWNAGGRP